MCWLNYVCPAGGEGRGRKGGEGRGRKGSEERETEKGRREKTGTK